MKPPVKAPETQYVLTGFTPDTGFRVFSFEAVGTDRTRTEFTVRTDLSLIRQYGIPLQALPLLCRGLLERGLASDDRALTFTEEEMRMDADHRAADREAAQRRKPARRPPARPHPQG